MFACVLLSGSLFFQIQHNPDMGVYSPHHGALYRMVPAEGASVSIHTDIPRSWNGWPNPALPATQYMVVIEREDGDRVFVRIDIDKMDQSDIQREIDQCQG